MGNLGKYN